MIAKAAGFEVRDVENLREHYALTLRNWVRRLEKHHTEAAQLVGEAVYRTWRLYMSFSAITFESGQISVNQSLLANPVNGQAHLPMAGLTYMLRADSKANTNIEEPTYLGTLFV